MNRTKLGTTAGLLTFLAVLTLLSVSIAPTNATTTTVNVAIRLTWVSSSTQADVVVVNNPMSITISVTNLDSTTYTFKACKITQASPKSAKFVDGFTCSVATFTLAGGATTSFGGTLTIGSGLGYPVDCPGGCNLVIAYILTGTSSTGKAVQSYPGYLIADLESIG